MYRYIRHAVVMPRLAAGPHLYLCWIAERRPLILIHSEVESALTVAWYLPGANAAYCFPS